MNKLIALISTQPPGRLLVICLALVAAIGTTDYLTGAEMNLSLVYLAPIFMTAWALGMHAAIVMDLRKAA